MVECRAVEAGVGLGELKELVVQLWGQKGVLRVGETYLNSVCCVAAWWLKDNGAKQALMTLPSSSNQQHYVYFPFHGRLFQLADQQGKCLLHER